MQIATLETKHKTEMSALLENDGKQENNKEKDELLKKVIELQATISKLEIQKTEMQQALEQSNKVIVQQQHQLEIYKEKMLEHLHKTDLIKTHNDQLIKHNEQVKELELLINSVRKQLYSNNF